MPKESKKAMKKGLIIATITGLIDQLIKASVTKTGIFTTNTGAAFGILQNQQPLLIAIAIGVALCVTIVLLKKKFSFMTEAGLGLLLGGTVGNLIDRIARGHVIDYINMGWWPSFNIADTTNVIGVALIIIEEIGKEHIKRKSR